MNRKENLRTLALLLYKRRRLIHEQIINLLSASLNIQTELNTLIQIQTLSVMRMKQFGEFTKILLNYHQDKSEDKVKQFWENVVRQMNDIEFKQNFRVSRSSFKKIYRKIKSAGENINKYNSIPLKKRVAIALYALGTMESTIIVAKLFGLKVTTVKEIISEICCDICKVFNVYISTYPPTEKEIKRIVSGFEELGFPQCFGATGACSIEITQEMDQGNNFNSYENESSLTLLASCDHSSKFTYTNISSLGFNDQAFNNSSLKKFHEFSEIFLKNSITVGDINVPLLLIGDSSFPLTTYMMTPFEIRDCNQPIQEKVFNENLNKCHNSILKAFAQLKSRFRKLEKGLEVSPGNSNHIIQACCLLHNFLIIENDDSNLWLPENVEIATKIKAKSTKEIENCTPRAIAIRNAVAGNFLKN